MNACRIVVIALIGAVPWTAIAGPPGGEAALKSRVSKLSDEQFCTKELRKLPGKKSPLPQPWFDEVAARARTLGVDGGHLVLIQEGKVAVGMPSCGAIAAWGRPQDINRTTTAWGTREQWVYGNGNYLYLSGGRVESIQN